ncbi:MAG TPA: sulfatase-like hydrolase/transferase [Blastocatellia bacterium]|nr:sulfatase-like hydrolase/transferase [Blastocatellia bacterium]
MTKCSFVAVGSETDRRSRGVSRITFEYFQKLSLIPPLVHGALSKYIEQNNKYTERDRRLEYVESMKRISQESAAAAADANLSLAMIHFPAPHLPFLYDRRKDDFSLEDGYSYYDNLELVDRTLGELRRAMEAARVWDDTIVLVSSDHWWRVDDWQKEHLRTDEERAAISELDFIHFGSLKK